MVAEANSLSCALAISSDMLCLPDKGSGKQSGVCWFDAGCVGVSLSGISVWCSGAGVVEG